MIISKEKVKILLALAAIVIVFVIGFKLVSGLMETRSEPTLTEEKQSMDVISVDEITAEVLEKPSGFLSEYRLERERVRSKEISLLQKIASDPISTSRAKEEAYSKLIALADREEKELQAEALIKAQGFVDCAVVMNSAGTVVMISGNQADTTGQDRVRKSVSVATGSIEKSISVLEISPRE